MTIKQIRIVCQDWIKTNDKTGWQSLGGWYFKDDNSPMPNDWTVILQWSDKDGNPIVGVAEKLTTVTLD